MDEIIVVVPSRMDQTMVEVFSFDPKVVIAALNQELELRKARNPDISYKTPVFVGLDDRHRRNPEEVVSGIKSKCNWSELVPLKSAPKSVLKAKPETIPEFIRRVQHEYALLTKNDVEKVEVEIRTKT
jgi:hypothetical protein